MGQSLSQFKAGFDFEAHQQRMRQHGQKANQEVAERRAQQAKEKAEVRRKRGEPEHEQQCALIKWRDDQVKLGRMLELDLLFAIPNGGKRGKGTAGKLRAEGVKAGVSDLFLPVARRGFHGLFIEMKAENGKTTPLQEAFLLDIDEQGYMTAVCYSANDAILILENYLGVSSR